MSLEGTCHETFMRRVMAPLLESESEGDPDSFVRRSWKDSTTYLVIPMNSSFMGDEGVRCATGWPMVSMVLWRPDGSAIGEL